MRIWGFKLALALLVSYAVVSVIRDSIHSLTRVFP